MTRRALIIGNPGTPGASNYCAGVKKDVESYAAFLASPVGGLWYAGEIKALHQPDGPTTLREIEALKSVDYSMVIFCGHGEYSAQKRSTIVELKPGTDLDSMYLRAGAPRHTLILDCCRKIATPQQAITEAMAKIAMDSKSSTIQPGECRKYFDDEIGKCPTGIVVTYACDINQTAGDDANRGGYYSFSLISEAQAWSASTYVDTSKSYRTLKVVQAHDSAVPRVAALSGGRQTPTIEKPRSEPYFPFCIIA